MILFTTFYFDKNPVRQEELNFVLNRNINNSHITKIILLCENLPSFKYSSKVSLVNVGKRLTFNEIITIANRIDSMSAKIICNSDIFFDETLVCVEKNLVNNVVYCLTRWDYIDEYEQKFYANFKSQDAWIFRGILPEQIGDFYMGLPGCDNRIAKELLNLGYQIENPSLSIKAIHVHGSNLRNYDKIMDKVGGEYAYPLPVELKGHYTKWGQMKEIESKKKFLYRKWKNNLTGVAFNLLDRVFARVYLYYLNIKNK